MGVAQPPHDVQHMDDQRLRQALSLMLPADGYPVEPAGAGSVPAGDVVVGRGGGHLSALRILHEYHTVQEGLLPAAVISVPGLQTLLVGGEFLCGLLDVNPGVPVPRLIEDETVAVRKGMTGEIVQILLQQQFVVFYPAVMIVELQGCLIHRDAS